MNASPYDFIGIGVGPFNLGLACLAHPIKSLRGLFLDCSESFNWHPGMLLENVTLQTSFLGDLVTLADPTSDFSFLSYLKAKGRIYSFYIKEDFFMMRNEYNQYCRWVADRLPNVLFSRMVDSIDYDEGSGLYAVRCVCTKTGQYVTYVTRRLVLGTGTAPYWPECCRRFEDRVSHTASYLKEKKALQTKKSITIIGSGQSAAEVYFDLLQDIDCFGYSLNWITRSPRFFPLELTKLTLEMTSPDYTSYFQALAPHKRDRLIKTQKNLYKGINASLINDIYDLLYAKQLVCDFQTELLTNTELRDCRYIERNGVFELDLFQTEQETRFKLNTEALVLATGYEYRAPDFLKPISDRIRWDENGRFDVASNYCIDVTGGAIFVQNAELHTHGFVAPDLGMACNRNAHIIRELLGHEYYPIERRIAFQQFSAPENLARATSAVA